MGNGINQNLNETDTITSIISSDTFVSLDPNLQNKIIDTVHNDRERMAVLWEKFWGISQLMHL